jgi:hypothetical protein
MSEMMLDERDDIGHYRVIPLCFQKSKLGLFL